MAGKRGNGEGSVRLRSDGKTWEARLLVGYKADGNPDRRSKYFKTQAEALKWLRETQTSIERNEYVDSSKITVAQWLETWINEYIKPECKPTTIGAYLDAIRLHINPAIGRMQLQKLRSEHVQAMCNRMREAGLKPSTVKKSRMVLSGALNQAVKNRIITRNVAECVDVKQGQTEEIKPLSPEEQRAYMAALPDTPSGRMLTLILYTGLRIGEACGLRWQDVSTNSFKVSQTVRRVPTNDSNAESRTQIATSTPKTQNGRREIPITKPVREILNTQREYQFAHGLYHNDGDLIFTTATGNPFEVRNVGRTHYGTLEKINAEKRGVHNLRHTFATRAVESGVMDYKTLSEILGHSDVTTTLRLYVHSSKETKATAMNALADIM